MGRRGDPCDDAEAESLVGTPEHEEARSSGYEPFAGVIARLPRLLEEAHDAGRPRSALGYVSPARLEEINTREAA